MSLMELLYTISLVLLWLLVCAAVFGEHGAVAGVAAGCGSVGLSLLVVPGVAALCVRRRDGPGR
jgi:hypothetical protein